MQNSIKLSSQISGEFWEIPVLFEDEHLLALDKPSGLLASPDRNEPNRPNLIELLHSGIIEGKTWARQRKLDYLMNAHRLDFDTSGVLLLAKAKPVLVALANLFGSETPVQKYIALAQGAPTEDQFEVDAALAPHSVRPGEMRVDTKRGKRARTRFQVLERFSGLTLLSCQPFTSRVHQIRVHLRHRGLPLAGDRLYGGKALLLSRIALHAQELTLPHPMTGAQLSTPSRSAELQLCAAQLRITAPWPKDLTVAVKYLRKFAALPN